MMYKYLLILFAMVVAYPSAQASSGTGIQAPSQTTVFFTTPDDTKKIVEQADTTYLSQIDTVFSQETARSTIADLTNGVEQLKQQVAKLDAKYGTEDAQYLETRAEVMRIIDNIDSTKDVLNIAIKRIQYYQRNLVDSVSKITTIRAAFDETKANVEVFARFLYKLQNEYYTPDGMIDELKLFIKTDKDISNELSNTALVELVMEKMAELLQTLSEQEKALVLHIKNSNQNKIEIKAMIAQYQTKLTELQEQRKFLSDYLTLYESHKVKMNKELKYLFSMQSDVYKDIASTIQSVSNLEFEHASFDVESKIIELEKTEPYANRDENAAPLSWPIYPVKTISRYFGDSEYEQHYKVPFQGIEIPADQDTPLYAVDEGLVYKIANKDNI